VRKFGIYHTCLLVVSLKNVSVCKYCYTVRFDYFVVYVLFSYAGFF
jgi:hypothetical protein